MRLNSIFLGVALMAALPLSARADCSVNISVVQAPQTENIPQATMNYLDTRLRQLVTADGISEDPGMGQFFISGRFDHVLEDVVPGPPAQRAIHTTLTLFIGDLNARTIYASTTLEMRGVGTSTQRAFINAMRQLTPGNSSVRSFIQAGKDKILAYYDANYPQYLSRARGAADRHNYDEALWILSMIPECSRGYNDAAALTRTMFQKYIDQQGTDLLMKARSAWSTEPDQYGAAKAFEFLVQIDPESSAYAGAQSLAAEIKASVVSDRIFELREKYHDAVELEHARIAGARAVGEAWGRGQQPTTTNLMWLK